MENYNLKTPSNFKVTFAKKWLPKEISPSFLAVHNQTHRKWYHKLLGIYSTFDAKVLDDPIQVIGGFEYSIKIIREIKYILGIKYKTIIYDK